MLNKQYPSEAPSLESGIAAIKKRWPRLQSNSPEAPIFIFAAGWRSGSTFLQRLVMSSKEVVIWGEPYGHAALINSISTPIRCFTSDWPQANYFPRAYEGKELHDQWIANFYPPLRYLMLSHIRFFVDMLGLPAKHYGVARWGFKEVRLTVDHAIYLKWLFPRAKFVFLYRNPYHAYRSYHGWRTYKYWPNEPVFTAEPFGRHWRQLVADFRQGYTKIGGMLFSYEDLSEGKVSTEDLSDFLELKLSGKTKLARISGGRPARATARETDLSDQLEMLRKTVEPLASQLGYTG